jgi:hypothetical protein
MGMKANALYGVFITRITDHALMVDSVKLLLLAGKEKENWEDQVTLSIQELSKS